MDERQAPAPWDLLMIVGGLALAVGPFLPFVEAASGLGSISRNGIDLIGPETFILVGVGLISAYLGYARIVGPPPVGLARWGPVVGGLVALVLSGYYFTQISDRVDNTGSEFVVASIGIGLWLCLGGSVGVLLGAPLGRRAPVETTQPVSEPSTAQASTPSQSSTSALLSWGPLRIAALIVLAILVLLFVRELL